MSGGSKVLSHCPVKCFLLWIKVVSDQFILLSCPLRDAADLVVQGKGKYEELMVCSHEIAASTAQLVAASKVSRTDVWSLTLCMHLIMAVQFLWRSRQVLSFSLSPGESRQRQWQPAASAAGIPGRHTGHSSRRGLHQVWQIPD